MRKDDRPTLDLATCLRQAAKCRSIADGACSAATRDALLSVAHDFEAEAAARVEAIEFRLLRVIPRHAGNC
jgi:hypothetical protein